MTAKPLPQRLFSSSANTGPSEHDFPAVFTVDGTNRHEVILINPGLDLSDLRASISTHTETSPNCAEPLSKYKSKEVRDSVGAIKVRWALEGGSGRDRVVFPKETILTEENCEAVMRMMALGQGRDVLDVSIVRTQVQGGK